MIAFLIAIVILAIIASNSKTTQKKSIKRTTTRNSLNKTAYSGGPINSQTKYKSTYQPQHSYKSEDKYQPKVATYSQPDSSIINVSSDPVKIDYTNTYQEFWGVGSKYQKELNLTDEEVKALNSLIDTSNKFNSIEYCATTIIKLFIEARKYLEESFKNNTTSLEATINSIADIEITKHYRFRKNSQNYNSQLKYFKTTIYQCLYKECENYLRDHFSVGRKTELTWYMYSEEARSEYSMRISPLIKNYLAIQTLTNKTPDESSEIELNSYSKSRWKNGLESIKGKLDVANPTLYYEAVLQLGNQNKHNPAIENIFFEGSKLMAKYNKELALKLFVYYVHYDLISEVFDNKQFGKTIQKSLFKTEAELRSFEALINEFIVDKKLEKALQNVSNIFAPKRKKIQLDKTAIDQVKQQHSGTVELLNEVLRDETDLGSSNLNNSKEEIALAIKYPQESVNKNKFKGELKLSETQINTLILFSKNGYSVPCIDIEQFAKSNGVFRNSLIDSINDSCYEHLDDLLIEEENDNLIINENYYQKILA